VGGEKGEARINRVKRESLPYSGRKKAVITEGSGRSFKRSRRAKPLIPCNDISPNFHFDLLGDRAPSALSGSTRSHDEAVLPFSFHRTKAASNSRSARCRRRCCQKKHHQSSCPFQFFFPVRRHSRPVQSLSAIRRLSRVRNLRASLARGFPKKREREREREKARAEASSPMLRGKLFSSLSGSRLSPSRRLSERRLASRRGHKSRNRRFPPTCVMNNLPLRATSHVAEGQRLKLPPSSGTVRPKSRVDNEIRALSLTTRVG